MWTWRSPNRARRACGSASAAIAPDQWRPAVRSRTARGATGPRRGKLCRAPGGVAGAGRGALFDISALLSILPEAGARPANSRRAPGWSPARPGPARRRPGSRPRWTTDRWDSAGPAGSRTPPGPVENSGSRQTPRSSAAPCAPVGRQSSRSTNAPLSGQRWVSGSGARPSAQTASKTRSCVAPPEFQPLTTCTRCSAASSGSRAAQTKNSGVLPAPISSSPPMGTPPA